MAGMAPYIAIVIVQVLLSGLALFSKVAFNGGMNTFVFIFYRQAISLLFFAPFAIITVARGRAPALPPRVLLKIFMLAFFGFTITLNMYSIGVKNTSATVASAFSNSIPIFTFVLAVLFGMETLKFKSFSGLAKVIGLTLCICGVMVIAIYKGPELKPLNYYRPFLSRSGNKNHHNTSSNGTWIIGSFFMVCSSILWSLLIVLQGKILKEYPSVILFATLNNLCSTFQSFVVAMVFERHMSKWKLDWDEGLLAVVFSGIFVAGTASFLLTWCNDKKGPVFVGMFTPLTLIITIICSSFLLGEVIILGSILGGALMVGGLYSVLWGKRIEVKEKLLNVEDL